MAVNLTSGTPQQARALAARAARHGVDHVDGAAMSGTRPIGQPEALFLHSGPPEAFAAVEPPLRTLGRATYLGADPGAASLYDTALLGVNLGLLTGFYHALALLGAAGVAATTAAEVVTGYLPFAVGLLPEHGRQIDRGTHPPTRAASTSSPRPRITSSPPLRSWGSAPASPPPSAGCSPAASTPGTAGTGCPAWSG